MAFAAICDTWHAPNGDKLDQVATITCKPSADVRDLHDRMGVIVRQRDFSLWTTGSEDEAAELLVPLPDGSLDVEPALNVDWNAP